MAAGRCDRRPWQLRVVSLGSCATGSLRVGCAGVSLAEPHMTLLEAVVALVILALSAIGCLELSQRASQFEYSANQWNAAVSVAETRMAQMVLGASDESAQSSTELSAMEAARLSGTQVTREPWKRGLDLITVSVPVTDGKVYVLRKLVRATSSSNALGAR